VHRPTNRGLLILGGRDLGRDSRVKPVLPDVADQVDGFHGVSLTRPVTPSGRLAECPQPLCLPLSVHP